MFKVHAWIHTLKNVHQALESGASITILANLQLTGSSQMAPGQSSHMNGKGSVQSRDHSSQHPGLLKPTLPSPLELNYLFNSFLSHCQNSGRGKHYQYRHEPLPDTLFPSPSQCYSGFIEIFSMWLTKPVRRASYTPAGAGLSSI